MIRFIMNRSRSRLTVAFLVGLISLAAGAWSASLAQTWTEVGDAGDLPSTAQTTVGSGALTAIMGTIALDTDIDMYCIDVTDPANFSACLMCLMHMGPDLYLFDAAGKGVAVVQICSGGCKQIPPGFVTTAGTYYIAVAPSGALAFAGANPIWLPGTTVARAPDGPGAANPITSWGGSPQLFGTAAYTVNLYAGAEFCERPTSAEGRTWGLIKSLYR